MKQEIKEGAAPVEATSAGAARLKVGDRVRVLDALRYGPHWGQGGTPGTDLEMYNLIGEEFILEASPDARWPLFGKSFYWLPQWLELVTPAPSPEPAEAAPAGAEKELIAALKVILNLAEHGAPHADGDQALFDLLDKIVDGARAALTKAQGSR